MADEISIKVDGLQHLAGTPDAIAAAQYRFVEELTQGLGSAMRQQIRSRSGRLAGSWHGHALSSTQGVVETTGLAYGKASVRGAYIRARRGRVLAFRNRQGELTFRKWVRLAPGNWIGRPDDRRNSYVTRTLRQRRLIAQEAFKRTLGAIQ